MDRYVFGVDLGGTTVKLGIFTPTGDVIDKWEIPTVKDNGGAQILPDIANSIKAKMAEKGATEDNIIGVGIGVPGPVDKDGFVNKAVNLGWTSRVDLEGDLHELTGLHVKGGNDANVAALGEAWKGGAEGYDDVVVVTLGTGIGGGIIVNGKILVGSNGAGGEIGHIHIESSETQACGCGNRGCLEQYGSATGIVMLANRRLAEDDAASVLRNGEISAKSIFDALKAGDKVAEEIVEVYGDYLGKDLQQWQQLQTHKYSLLVVAYQRQEIFLFHILVRIIKNMFSMQVLTLSLLLHSLETMQESMVQLSL